MTKLKEKLLELEYILDDYDKDFMEYKYVKKINVAELHIFYNHITKTYYGLCITTHKVINQLVIDNLQQAYNRLTKDLEELKEYENKNI